MSDFNPYKAPAAAHLADTQIVVGDPARVPLSNAPAWIVSGYRLFAGSWPTWLLIISIFIGIFMLLQVFVVLTSAVLIGEIIGSLVMLPLLVGGIVTGFHWLAQDKPLPVVSLFAGFVTRPGALIAGGLMAYLIMALLVLVALTMSGFGIDQYLVLIRGQDEAAITELISSREFFSFMGWVMPLMLPATVIYYFTISQIALGSIPATRAIVNSFRAVLGNLHVMLWGFVVLFFIGILLLLVMTMVFALISLLPIDPDTPAGIGLYSLIVTVLFGAPAIACLFGINYAAFRDIFMRPATSHADGTP
ncbi:MAG: hypothetical protein HKN70_02340 [Gammaproteobacteria bacterium]|nr:hypothetical protein [Gammaproteobacteria bacterium]